jgi:hypothetical protein
MHARCCVPILAGEIVFIEGGAATLRDFSRNGTCVDGVHCWRGLQPSVHLVQEVPLRHGSILVFGGPASDCEYRLHYPPATTEVKREETAELWAEVAVPQPSQCSNLDYLSATGKGNHMSERLVGAASPRAPPAAADADSGCEASKSAPAAVADTVAAPSAPINPAAAEARVLTPAPRGASAAAAAPAASGACLRASPAAVQALGYIGADGATKRAPRPAQSSSPPGATAAVTETKRSAAAALRALSSSWQGTTAAPAAEDAAAGQADVGAPPVPGQATAMPPRHLAAPLAADTVPAAQRRSVAAALRALSGSRPHVDPAAAGDTGSGATRIDAGAKGRAVAPGTAAGAARARAPTALKRSITAPAFPATASAAAAGCGAADPLLGPLNRHPRPRCPPAPPAPAAVVAGVAPSLPSPPPPPPRGLEPLLPGEQGSAEVQAVQVTPRRYAARLPPATRSLCLPVGGPSGFRCRCCRRCGVHCVAVEQGECDVRGRGDRQCRSCISR